MSGPYAVENAILDRLSARLSPLVRVASGAALSAQALSPGELAPIVIVEPIEAEVSSQSARADHVIEGQEWVAAVIVRHTADLETLRCDYSDLDNALVTVICALSGWKPGGGTREMRYVARGDILHEPGLLEVRLSFSTFYHLSVT